MRKPARPARAMKGTWLLPASAALVALGSASAAAQAPPAPQVPQPPPAAEAYGDWQVRCPAASQPCVARHEQSNETGERLLAIEIARGANGQTIGTALLPFGVLLQEGVRFEIETVAVAPPLPFRTCVPEGCIVTFDLDPSMLEQMRRGTVLSANLVSITGEQVELAISLAGFTAATDRLAALASDR